MRLHTHLTGLTLSLLLTGQASAIVLFNLDNSANQTDPGAGVPWDSVGRVRNSGGTATAGSAVYLGNGYVLTANHVVTNSGTFNTVEFGPGLVYPIDFGYTPTQVAAGVDLKVFRLLDHNPIGLDVAMLLTTPGELIGPSVAIGWGRGRDPSILPGTTTVNWGTDATIAKRWGENVPRGLTPVTYTLGPDSYNYQTVYTIAGAGSGTPAGLGDSEAAVTTYDSGGALFQLNGGQWFLIGVTVASEFNGNTVFGNDQNPDPRGSASFYARVSDYDTQIMALVPEPSVYAALAGLGALALALRRRRS